MLTLERGLARSHNWASLGIITGALSFTSIRWICRVPVPLAGGEPDRGGARGERGGGEMGGDKEEGEKGRERQT